LYQHRLYYCFEKYKITSTISIDKPQKLILKGAGSFASNETGATINYTGTGTLFSFGTADGNPDSTGFSGDYTLKDLSIKTTTGAIAVSFTNCCNLFSTVYVTAFASPSLYDTCVAVTTLVLIGVAVQKSTTSPTFSPSTKVIDVANSQFTTRFAVFTIAAGVTSFTVQINTNAVTVQVAEMRIWEIGSSDASNLGQYDGALAKAVNRCMLRGHY